MTLTPIAEKYAIDLGSADTAMVFRVPSRANSGRAQVVANGGAAWPASAVVSIEQSLDGGSAWGAFATAVTLNADGVTATFPVVPGSMVRGRVSTAGGSSVLAAVYVWSWMEP